MSKKILYVTVPVLLVVIAASVILYTRWESDKDDTTPDDIESAIATLNPEEHWFDPNPPTPTPEVIYASDEEYLAYITLDRDDTFMIIADEYVTIEADERVYDPNDYHSYAYQMSYTPTDALRETIYRYALNFFKENWEWDSDESADKKTHYTISILGGYSANYRVPRDTYDIVIAVWGAITDECEDGQVHIVVTRCNATKIM